MRGRWSDCSESAKNYLSDAFNINNKNYKEIASELGISEDRVIKYIEKGQLPTSYELFYKVFKCVGGREEDLEKLLNADPVILFNYWNYSQKNCAPIEKMGHMINDMLFEKGIDNLTVAKATNSSPSYVSLMRNCKNRLSFEKLCELADLLETTPERLLEEYKCFENSYETIQNLHNYIKDARISHNWSYKEAALSCRISSTYYKNYENCEKIFTPGLITKLATGLGLSAQTIFELSKAANLFKSENSYDNATKKYERKKIGEKSINDLFGMILDYKWVLGNDIRIPAHTFVTLIALILLNENKSDFSSEIAFYLKNMGADENLIKKYYAEYEQNGYDYILSKSKTNGMNFEVISKVSGVSSYIVQKVLSNSRNTSFSNIAKICKAAGLSPALIIEEICKETYEYSNVKRDTAKLDDIVATVESVLFWNFEHRMIKPNALVETIYLVFSDYSPAIKTIKLCDINFN